MLASALLVLRGLCGCGRRSDYRRVSSHSLLTLDMFRLRAMVCFGVFFCMRTVGCMQCHRVGIIVHVLLVQVAEGILDGLPA